MAAATRAGSSPRRASTSASAPSRRARPHRFRGPDEPPSAAELPRAHAAPAHALRPEPLRAQGREVDRVLALDRRGARVRPREQEAPQAAAELVALPAAVEIAEPTVADHARDLVRRRAL